MRWKETYVMDLRFEFVMRSLREERPFRELCKEYGISPKTGYKWKERFVEQGLSGLEDLSRKPQNSPTQFAENVVCAIVRIKEAHRKWGSRKILEAYCRQQPRGDRPSESTVKRVLEKTAVRLPVPAPLWA